MIENEKQERAFELYVSMGEKRSLRKLARRMGVAPSTAKAWSKEFSWGERLAERDRGIAQVVRSRTEKAEVDSQIRNRQFVQMALVATARQIAEGKIRATMSDLDRLIRLERFLEGEVESRHELVARELAGKSIDELRLMLQRELKELTELTGEEPEQLVARIGPDVAELDRELDQVGPERSDAEDEAAEKP
jgi:hypothetical protein